MTKTTEHTGAFKAEVRQLLDLVVHSLYSKKEVFLRELISNASDAIDRAQFEGLTDASLIEDAPEWAIHLHLDCDAKTLCIEDNGIGMTAEEAEANLGTIARSGTRAFLDALKAKHSGEGGIPELIGQFGVGFYAAFMVAAQVTVASLRRGHDQQPVRWISDGEGQYRIEPGERSRPGTAVTLTFREDSAEFADPWRIRDIVSRYSDYIAYPIRLSIVKDGKSETDDKPLNQTKAIWKRPKSEISTDEYNAFYKHINHAGDEPLRIIHFNAEGTLEFQALLFIPRRAPMDLFMPNRNHGLSLYVRNVFIGNQFDALLPEYLRFVVGVVDSSDLPLNVSRETLQDDAVIRRIRSNLVSRVIDTLETMKTSSPGDYEAFYRAFGSVLKEGMHSDGANREKLKELLLFPHLQGEGDALISLRDYRGTMPSRQQAVYVLQTEDLAAARQSPHLEWCRDRHFDVLFLPDPIDAWVLPFLDPFDGMPVRPVDRGEIDPADDQDDAAEDAEKSESEAKTTSDALNGLLSHLKTALKDQVQDVRSSERLNESACCLVADSSALPPGMERVMRAMGQDLPRSKRILEINPAHPLIDGLRQRVEAGADASDLKEIGDTLLALALLAEGSPVPEPGKLARQMASLMAKADQSGSADRMDVSPA